MVYHLRSTIPLSFQLFKFLFYRRLFIGRAIGRKILETQSKSPADHRPNRPGYSIATPVLALCKPPNGPQKKIDNDVGTEMLFEGCSFFGHLPKQFILRCWFHRCINDGSEQYTNVMNIHALQGLQLCGIMFRATFQLYISSALLLPSLGGGGGGLQTDAFCQGAISDSAYFSFFVAKFHRSKYAVAHHFLRMRLGRNAFGSKWL
jgi:hypothetical protein